MYTRRPHVKRQYASLCYRVSPIREWTEAVNHRQGYVRLHQSFSLSSFYLHTQVIVPFRRIPRFKDGRELVRSSTSLLLRFQIPIYLSLLFFYQSSLDMCHPGLELNLDKVKLNWKTIVHHLLEELTRRFNMDFIGFSTFWVSFTFPNKCVGVVNETSANTSSVNELSSRWSAMSFIIFSNISEPWGNDASVISTSNMNSSSLLRNLTVRLLFSVPALKERFLLTAPNFPALLFLRLLPVTELRVRFVNILVREFDRCMTLFFFFAV